LGATLIGVSTDGPWLQSRFHSACNLPYPLIAEGGKSVVESFGLKTRLLGFAKRRTVVIDSDGTVRGLFKGKETMDPRTALALCRSLVTA
jgi:peroxiredoxin